MKKGKYGYILMAAVLVLSVLFFSAVKNKYEGQQARIKLQAEEITSLPEEGTEDTERDDPEETEEPASAKEVITNDHDLKGCMWMYYKDEEVPFVDEEIFGLIWEAYKEADYTVGCEKGDLSVYEDYKQKFWRLLQNEIPFWDRETGKEVYIKDWTDSRGIAKIKYIEQCIFYFFDVNGDGLPELCVSGGHTAVFAYDAAVDRISLWSWTGPEITGTRTGAYYPNHATEVCQFFRFDADGDMEFEILFWAEHSDLYHYDINMVMLPNYADRDKRWEITEEMKQQGVYEESSGQWFFRITDEQYEKLEKPYVNLLSLAYSRRRECAYTYEGLFGEYMTE